jgi:prepilin peptidase CpaA
MTTTLITTATLVVFPAFMAYAAASDLFSMRISNRICIGLVAAFVVFAALCQMPLPQLGWHVGAGALVLVITFGMFAAGWIGGGDAKLAAATALWIGPELLPLYFMISSFAGGMLTLWILNMRDHPLPRFAVRWSWVLRLHAPKNGVPYGIALALAGLAIFPQSAIWKSVVLFA